MIERAMNIGAGTNRLSGTACLPSETGCFPTVLMVHGSGPLDRDENMKGQRLDVFNTIAHGLAGAGVASLRYDKRGCGASAGDYYSAGHVDLVDDAVHWCDALRQEVFCAGAPLFVLGHSEGCLIAAQVSVRRPTLAGLVLLCPFVEGMESMLVRQAEQLEKEVDAVSGVGGALERIVAKFLARPVVSQRTLIAKVKASSAETLHVRGQKIPAKWLRELLDIDPTEVFARIVCPMLLVGGEKDLQCRPVDVQRIASVARGVVDAHVVRNLTHVLRVDERQPTLRGSVDLLAKPMEFVVLEVIAEWLGRQCDASPRAARTATRGDAP